jgi:hypothetical protein
MSPAPSAPSRLAPLVLAAWVLGLSVLPPSATRIDTWPAAGWLLAGWIAALVLGIGQARSLRLGARRELALVAFGLATVVSAWASPWRGGSLAAATGTLAGLAGLYALVGGFRGPARERLGAALDFGAVGVVAAGLMFWLWPAVSGGLAHVGSLSLRNDFPFGHVNYTAGAGLLAAAWLAASALGAAPGGRSWRFLGAGFAAFLVISSGSRAGVAALAAGVGLFTLSLWLHRGRRSRDAILGAVLMLVVGLGAVLSNERLRSLVTEGRWNALAAASNTQRAALAAAAAELGSSHGLLGPGPGTTPLAYSALAGRSPYVGAPDGTLQLHSVPLQVWATTGAVGAAALLLLIATFLPATIRALRAEAPLGDSAAASGVLAYALFALTDHQLDIPFVQVFLLASVARLIAREATESATTPFAAPGMSAGRKLAATGALALIVLVLAGPVVQRTRDVAARAAFAGAVHAHDTRQPVSALRALGHAGALAPWDRFYGETAAAWQWGDPATQGAATDALRPVVARPDPWPSEFALYNLAWLELQAGQPGTAATEHFAAAARLAPHRRGVHLGQALAALRNDDTAAAIRALARECLANPTIITEAWWQEPTFQAIVPAVSASVAQQAGQLAAVLSTEEAAETLRANAALIAWWLQPDPRTAADLANRLPAARAALLRDLVAAPARGAGTWTGATSWGLLGEAWATGTVPAAVVGREAAQLGARLVASRDFLEFVTAPLGEATTWRRAERTLRGGHRVIMRHPDAPVAADVPVFERNLLLAPHTGTLFPARGWIPGHAWHEAGLLP